MSDNVVSLPAFRRERVWVVVLEQPGLYRAELRERGTGVIYATAAAPWKRTGRFLQRVRGSVPAWMRLESGWVRL